VIDARFRWTLVPKAISQMEKSMRTRSGFSVGTVLSGLLFALAAVGCRGLLVEPSSGTVSLDIAFSIVPEIAADGVTDAFARADQIFVRVEREGSPAFEVTQGFDPTSAETTVSLDISLAQQEESASITIELRQGSSVLFEAVHQVLLRAGATVPIEVAFAPVPSAVVIGGEQQLQFDAVGGSVQLSAAVTFATGDAIPNSPIAWSSTNAGVATVNQQGLVSIRSEGDATIRATYGSLSDEVQVRVRQVVASISVTPTSGTVEVGKTLQLTAVLRDPRNVPITGRTVSWVSLGATASVSQSGVVLGVAPGAATITATADGRTASSQIAVVEPPRSGGPFTGSWGGEVRDPNGSVYEIQLQVVQSGSTATGSLGVPSGSSGFSTFNLDWLDFVGTIQGNSLAFTTSDSSNGYFWSLNVAVSADGRRLLGDASECYPDYFCYDYTAALDRIGGDPVDGASSQGAAAATAGTSAPRRE
jgi:hypothetical protein